MPESRALKQRVLGLLQASDFRHSLDLLLEMPGRQVVNPLFSFLLNSDEKVRWAAVTAMGAVVANLAGTDMESARVIMRRLMWSLNDESGGIGWGAPEVMGETMARNEALAKEYSPVFSSYFSEEGNFLEYEALQRGLLWGLIRLVRARPDPALLEDGQLGAYLKSTDAVVRGLAAWAAGLMGHRSARRLVDSLRGDDSRVRLYLDGAFVDTTVADLATRGMELLDHEHGP